jgi:hypothetical protein
VRSESVKPNPGSIFADFLKRPMSRTWRFDPADSEETRENEPRTKESKGVWVAECLRRP